MRFATGAAALSVWLRHATALHVAKGSPCQTLCGNVLDATTKDDVVCKESDYSVSAAGSVYQQCVSCELTSDYSTASQTDVQWLLCMLNTSVRTGSTMTNIIRQPPIRCLILHFRVSRKPQRWVQPMSHEVCQRAMALFVLPSNSSNRTACEPFQDAIKYNDLASNGTEFDYCDNWDHNQLSGCTACLRAGDNHYLTNCMS